MTIFTKDGLTLVSELMDGAVMYAGVLPNRVAGREKIISVLKLLDNLYASLTDLDRRNTEVGELIVSQARLFSGEKVTIKIAGLRDRNGWIETMTMTHSPRAAMNVLSKQLLAILYPGDLAA